MKVTKSEYGTNEYASDDGMYRVWFKFGCAHIDFDGGEDPLRHQIDSGVYVHVCEPMALMEFLTAAMVAEANDPESNSYVAFSKLRG